MDEPPARVWPVVRDCQHFSSFMPRTRESTLVERGADTSVCRIRMDMPFPFADLVSESRSVERSLATGGFDGTVSAGSRVEPETSIASTTSKGALWRTARASPVRKTGASPACTLCAAGCAMRTSGAPAGSGAVRATPGSGHFRPGEGRAQATANVRTAADPANTRSGMRRL